MPTTVHIPSELLSTVDAEARKRNISRNRFVIEALERAVERNDWSDAFLAALNEFDPDDRLGRAIDAMLGQIIAHRSSKRGSPL